MSEHDDDSVLSQVGALPEIDVDARVSERIRRRAQSVLAHNARLARRPWLARADRVYTRVIEPPLVLAACVIYLVWAFQNVLALIVH